MTEAIRVRAEYRFASVQARDAALAAALGTLEDCHVPCEITLGAIVVVELAVPLFADPELGILAVLERGAIESSWAAF